MNTSTIQLIECPRDAMQGWPHPIPAAQKAGYINALLKVGFHTIDFGSFVSAKLIPQMADTKEVLAKLEMPDTGTRLLAIVANLRGAGEAFVYDEINCLGFPFSISPTFQLRNTNSSIEESFIRVSEIQELCIKTGRQLVVYLSMAFGNPYGDAYHEEILLQWAERLVQTGIETLSLADTVGMATPGQVSFALQTLIPRYPDITVGVHLHAAPGNWMPKIEAAVAAGCTRFDGTLKGIGGCPMAQDSLVGNIDTGLMIPFFEAQGLLHGLDHEALAESNRIAAKLFA